MIPVRKPHDAYHPPSIYCRPCTPAIRGRPMPRHWPNYFLTSMLTSSYPGVLTDLLYTQAKEFMGIYDPGIGWFTQVNPAGVRLLGYPSEPAFLADPDHSLRTPPWTGP